MKICLIGSTRFIDQYREVNQTLTKMGHVVYSVCMASTGKPEDREDLTDDEKETLDLVHLMKLMASDVACLITDGNGYVGFSTRRELKWCLLLGKQVLFPDDFKGLKENMEGLITAIEKAARDRENSKFKSKLDVGEIRI